MVGSMEPDHLEVEGLHPIMGWIPKGDGQIDLPEWHGLHYRHDAMERRPGRPDTLSVDAHGVEHFGIHDVEAAASIHRHLSELLHADDRVDHEQVSSQLQDAFRVVDPIKGYGRLRPLEEVRRD